MLTAAEMIAIAEIIAVGEMLRGAEMIAIAEMIAVSEMIAVIGIMPTASRRVFLWRPFPFRLSSMPKLWTHYPSGSLGTPLFRATEPLTDSYSDAGKLTSSEIETAATTLGSGGLWNGPETSSRSGHWERNGLATPRLVKWFSRDAFDYKLGRDFESPG